MNKFEFWFRKEYSDLLHDRQLTCFVRPGIRLAPAPKGTRIGERVLVRFLEKPGTPHSDPELNPFMAEAVVMDLRIKKIGEMDAADFQGSAPDASSQEGVIAQLERIYGQRFGIDDTVTVFRIAYES